MRLSQHRIQSQELPCIRHIQVWLVARADVIFASAGSSSQPADSVYTYVEACVITSEEAYSCEEPEETIVLLAKVWRHSCHL